METIVAKTFTEDYVALRKLFIKEDASIEKRFFKSWIKLRGAMTVGEAEIEASAKMKTAKMIKAFKRQSAYERSELAVMRELDMSEFSEDE